MFACPDKPVHSYIELEKFELLALIYICCQGLLRWTKINWFQSVAHEKQAQVGLYIERRKEIKDYTQTRYSDLQAEW